MENISYKDMDVIGGEEVRISREQNLYPDMQNGQHFTTLEALPGYLAGQISTSSNPTVTMQHLSEQLLQGGLMMPQEYVRFQTLTNEMKAANTDESKTEILKRTTVFLNGLRPKKI
ncbi:MAG: hypothetical protein NT010_11070 [Proteobacteria bacterium]|nr:hypothetical protein [Pseudomonadota bacterium]